MSECYSAALAANTTTIIALLVGALVGWLLGKLLVMAFERWEIRRDRKRLAELLEAEKTELDRLRARE
ncbi:DUF1049 domain-containing protein [Trueperella pyogenes]|uniref:DUF1049 domain-containing protein n=1 Tax=Trueperella pyogenes TaxID=1661 RepID=UPI00242A67EB|nr:DUF1049 domain-containing protein [Trueperella pyogenes]MCI7689631.1 DUF1049 domain-containing protein [Trueperella pyogenes]